MTSATLDRRALARDVDRLATLHPGFASARETNGVPPLWARPATFRTLVEIVNEQKISLQSAHAIGLRVAALCRPFTPTRFLAVPQAALRQAGMSDAKIGYGRSIAEAIARGDLRLSALVDQDDDAVIRALTAVRGIGPWTAGVWLTMAMVRRDAWPPGDRALVLSAAALFSLTDTPSYGELDAMAERWRPCRGAASRLLWHDYLCRRGREMT